MQQKYEKIDQKIWNMGIFYFERFFIFLLKKILFEFI
jgi:hypothetical protein